MIRCVICTWELRVVETSTSNDMHTGDPLSTSWSYGKPGHPDSSNIVCTRAVVEAGVPVSFVDTRGL